MTSRVNENPFPHVKLRVPRSNSLSNSLNVPGNSSTPKKTIHNRNSMLEYRYMENSSHVDAYTLNNFLDNLPSSEFDAMYPNEMNSNTMSTSVPDSTYFDLLTLSSNTKQETDKYSDNERFRKCDYKTTRITYPTSYVGTSEPIKVLNCGVPTAKTKVSTHRNSANYSSNFSDPSRGYDSEPNWTDRPVTSNSSNYHDDMTRKWVERGRNNSYRTSLSLNLVKQSSWHEFDDDDNWKSSIPKRKKNPDRQREVVVPNAVIEHSKNRTAKVINKNDEEQKKKIRKSSKEFIECKTYFDKTKLQPKTDTQKDVSSTQKNEKIPKQSMEISKKSSQSSESGSDDVFESPNRKRNPRFTKRRSSSLDALTSNPPFIKSTGNSSVSINDNPEYFEYPKSPLLTDLPNPSGSVANSASNFHNSLGTTLLHTTPKRPSIKKSSNENTKHSSDYDVRDRGRGRNSNGGRDSYRERHRERERDPDRGLSDREQRESFTRSSFNRSMSNAEGTPEDKIGEPNFYCTTTTVFITIFAIDGNLSDTAVSLQGLEMSRRRPDQRSPKSETSLNRDRERFGAGMGKKSNSTSQLSATGKTIIHGVERFS